MGCTGHFTTLNSHTIVYSGRPTHLGMSAVVTQEDLWKGIKTVLLDVAREIIGSLKMQKEKNGYLIRLLQQSGKREKQKAKIRTDTKN